ncbi:MAG: TPM domain-containing protein, partial [Vicinamibacterales bacterium]
MRVSCLSFVVRRSSFVAGLTLALTFLLAGVAGSQPKAAPLPELTAPVNDFAKVIDADSARALDRMIRTLQTATGDIVVIATVPTIEPYGDISEYAVKLFANNGKGIGQKGKNNGLLILLALKERRVKVEVGYDLEQWITDGFSGETSREVMAPFFRDGRYGEGLRAGAERIIGRIAQGRGVTLDGVRVPRQSSRQRGSGIPGWLPIAVFLAILFISRIGGGGG